MENSKKNRFLFNLLANSSYSRSTHYYRKFAKPLNKIPAYNKGNILGYHYLKFEISTTFILEHIEF